MTSSVERSDYGAGRQVIGCHDRRSVGAAHEESATVFDMVRRSFSIISSCPNHPPFWDFWAAFAWVIACRRFFLFYVVLFPICYALFRVSFCGIGTRLFQPQEGKKVGSRAGNSAFPATWRGVERWNSRFQTRFLILKKRNSRDGYTSIPLQPPYAYELRVFAALFAINS